MIITSLDVVKNFAHVIVSGLYTAGQTSITLQSGEGVKLPQPSTDGAFQLVFWDATTYGDPSFDPLVEICRCTARTDDVLTVTRGTEGTADSNKNTAGRTYHMILAFTKKSYDELSTSTTVADSASATCWPLLHESATGTLVPKSDVGLTYNATTANLTTTTFTGALVGNATTSTNTTGNAATVTVADAGEDTTTYPLLGIDLTGNMSPRTDAGLSYQGTTNALTATTFIGALTGAASLNVLKAGDTMTGSLAMPTVTKAFADTGYALTISDYTVLANAVGGAITLNLPTAVGITGRIYVIKKIDAGASIITVDANGSETIDGALTQTIANQWESIMIQSDGANWVVI